MDGPKRLAAICRLDDLAQEYRTHRPFRAETEPLQRPHHEHLVVVLDEPADERKHRKPADRQLQDPGSQAWTTYAQITNKWPKSDPRYSESPAEEIEAIKKVRASDLRSFYKEFVGAGHGELVVVGDFDPAAVSSQVEKLFGTWQTKKPYARLVDKAFGVPATEKSVDVKDKENVNVVFGFDVAMKDTDADYPAC